MPRIQRVDPRQQARVIKMCADYVGKNRGASFDAIYRALVEQGIEPDSAHLALEKFMHDAQRARKPKS
jgi:hypothetical protein